MKQLHEYAKFFPPLTGEEFKALCQNVKENGLRQPITLKDDLILDGVNRAKACDETGVRPKYENFNGGDALDYVISQNVMRRHLTTSQRAILALELEKKFSEEKATKGRTRSGGGAAAVRDRSKDSAERAAKALHVSSQVVKQAKRLAKEAPEAIPAIRAGKMTVREALVDKLNQRAESRAKKVAHKEKMKRLQKENRQVAEFLAATKSFIVALKIASDSIERFSPEAVSFVSRRHDEIRDLMTRFEKALKKKFG